MLTRLRNLQPGALFTVPETGQRTELIKINDCRAYVRVQGDPVLTSFETRTGEIVEFVKPGGRCDNWAPSMIVEAE